MSCILFPSPVPIVSLHYIHTIKLNNHIYLSSHILYANAKCVKLLFLENMYFYQTIYNRLNKNDNWTSHRMKEEQKPDSFRTILLKDMCRLCLFVIFVCIYTNDSICWLAQKTLCVMTLIIIISDGPTNRMPIRQL